MAQKNSIASTDAGRYLHFLGNAGITGAAVARLTTDSVCIRIFYDYTCMCFS